MNLLRGRKQGVLMSEESLDMRTTVALVKVRVELLSDCTHEGRNFIRRAVDEISEESFPQGGLPVPPQLLGGSPLPIHRLNNVQVRSVQEEKGRSNDAIGVGLKAPWLFVAHGRTGHILGGFVAGEEDREVVAHSSLGKVHRASKVNKGDISSILSGYDPVVGLEMEENLYR